MEMANDYYHFDKIVQKENMQKFLSFDDTVISRMKIKAEKKQQAGILRIFKRIEERDLYKFVTECRYEDKNVVIPNFNDWQPEERKMKLEQMIQAYLEQSKISKPEFEVLQFQADFSMGKQNPLDTVDFWKEDQPGKKFKLQEDLCSSLLPNKFQKKYIRIF